MYLVPAVITEPSSDQTFSPILGANNFTILCAATGVSAPNVSIIRLSLNHSVGTLMKIKLLDTGLMLSETSLVFDTVTGDAEGSYECQARNELAQLKRSFEVSVDGKHEIIIVIVFNNLIFILQIILSSTLNFK